MKKQITTIIVSCIFIIVLITGCNNSTNKGYEVEKIDTPILVDGILVDENKYEFSTIVQLKDENILTAAMIEIKLTTEIKLDDITNKYVLNNSKLDINSIGCNIDSSEPESIDSDVYTKNYQIAVKQNENFKQTMDVGYAKLLLQDANIQINSISSMDSDSNIKTIKDLEGFKDNSKVVFIDYYNLNNYFSAWYQIKFELDSKDKGIFTIF